MIYQPPTVESRQIIDEAFVLGTMYGSPTWTEKDSKGSEDSA
jgi:hypothetical protein